MSDSDSLIGKELAHFQVIDKLGEGGMGAVYRARDTKLARDVALKVLPEQLAQEPERLARLRREAQVLASLNHTNIAAIYGFEELDGRLILELELVEGEELAQRLKRGLLPVDETIDLASQIASGLDEAHERGIIHRDLKPANLMITPEGVVKILDFGLAKPYAGEVTNDGVSQLATVTGDDLTREGVIMGTASYMSPEQARGRKVDRRADIWAYGCVLFEMLTGRRAFVGETMTDVLVSVVTGEPDWSLLPAYTPPGVRRLLRRCLQRDPRKRLRNLGDAVIELAEVSEPENGDVIEFPVSAESNRGLALWAVLGPLIGIGLGLVLWWLIGMREPPDHQRPARQMATVSGPVAVYGSFASSLAVSPDAGQLVYSAGDPQQLYLKLADQVEPVSIPGTDGAVAPFFSPDGGFIGFWADGEVRKIPVGGGTAVRLCETNRYFFGAAWSSDGFVYFSRPWVHPDGESRVSLVRVPSTGGAIEVVAGADAENGRAVGLTWPSALPDGQGLLVTRWSSAGSPPTLEVVSPADGARETIVEGYQQAMYLPSGHIVASNQEGNVVALPFDLAGLAVDGEPVVVARDAHSSRYGAKHFTSGVDGAVYWVPETGGIRPNELVWVDRDGEITPASTHLRDYESPRLSDNGFVAVSLRDAPDSVNVWILDLVRDTLRPLTLGSGYSRNALWTPDGFGVVFSVPLGNEALPAGIYLRQADQQAEPLLLVPGPLRMPTSMSRDGATLFLHTIGVNRGWDVWRAQTSGDEVGQALLAADYDQSTARVSPDGEWIAFEADASGRPEIYVRQIEQGIEGQVSPHGGQWPMWSSTGDELFFLTGSHLMSVKIRLGQEPDAEPARELFSIAGLARTFDVATDGSRFLMVRLGKIPTGKQINLALDWQRAVGPESRTTKGF